VRLATSSGRRGTGRRRPCPGRAHARAARLASRRSSTKIATAQDDNLEHVADRRRLIQVPASVRSTLSLLLPFSQGQPELHGVARSRHVVYPQDLRRVVASARQAHPAIPQRSPTSRPDSLPRNPCARRPAERPSAGPAGANWPAARVVSSVLPKPMRSSTPARLLYPDRRPLQPRLEELDNLADDVVIVGWLHRRGVPLACIQHQPAPCGRTTSTIAASPSSAVTSLTRGRPRATPGRPLAFVVSMESGTAVAATRPRTTGRTRRVPRRGVSAASPGRVDSRRLEQVGPCRTARGRARRGAGSEELAAVGEAVGGRYDAMTSGVRDGSRVRSRDCRSSRRLQGFCLPSPRYRGEGEVVATNHLHEETICVAMRL